MTSRWASCLPPVCLACWLCRFGLLVGRVLSSAQLHRLNQATHPPASLRAQARIASNNFNGAYSIYLNGSNSARGAGKRHFYVSGLGAREREGKARQWRQGAGQEHACRTPELCRPTWHCNMTQLLMLRSLH